MKVADIVSQVKYNCDISDAKFWGYFSLCGILLRLRELYKSEHNITPWSNINQQDIGEWITAKEKLWAEMQDYDFRDLLIEGHTFNPFDVAGINSYLIKHNLIYGAGFGLYKKPVFFLGELGSCFNNGSYTAYYVKREYARDLFTVSGMLQGNEIFIRLEQLRAIMWEMFLDFKCRKGSYVFNVFTNSGISPQNDIDDAFGLKLDSLALRYSDIILNHELAEAFEADAEWSNIILGIQDRKAEYFMRGLQDMLADTSEYGPLKKLIRTEDKEGLAFYISLSNIFHKTLYPEMRNVLSSFEHNADWGLLESVRQTVYAKCMQIKNKVLNAYRQSRNEDEFIKMISNLY